MATIVGTSQAWKEVRAKLGNDAPHTPDALRRARAQLQDEQPQRNAVAAERVRVKTLAAREKEANGAYLLDEARKEAADYYDPKILYLTRQIDNLRNARLLLLRWWNRLLVIPNLRRDVLARMQRRDSAGHAQAFALRALHLDRVRLEQDVQGAIAAELRTMERQLTELITAETSNEFAGAVAEHETARTLCQLPDGYTVFHDVHLELDRYIRFDGKDRNLKTAQADHIVVGPSGVFVIETKMWSQQFTNNGNYFDPFTQTRRTGLVCYCLLNDGGVKTRVREVIANHGAWLQKPAGCFVTVCHPTALLQLILGGQATLRPDHVTLAVEILHKYAAHG